MAYDLMCSVQPGDLVFSYFNSAIRAVGVVMNEARSYARPDFGLANRFWESDGWLIDVQFQLLDNCFDPKSLLHEYRIHGPTTHGPINSIGGANMEYLYAIPIELGVIYLDRISIDVAEIQAVGSAERWMEHVDDVAEEEDRRLRARTDIGPTEIRALTLARRGQGYFRNKVAHFERACRLTGVKEPRHLRASHIKPWRTSNDMERLDGSNGLLLSPHVDHLFDQGYLSFRQNGTILKSPQLSEQLLGRWRLDLTINVGRFTKHQESFLEYHRDVVLQTSEN